MLRGTAGIAVALTAVSLAVINIFSVCVKDCLRAVLRQHSVNVAENLVLARRGVLLGVIFALGVELIPKSARLTYVRLNGIN